MDLEIAKYIARVTPYMYIYTYINSEGAGYTAFQLSTVRKTGGGVPTQDDITAWFPAPRVHSCCAPRPLRTSPINQSAADVRQRLSRDLFLF